MSLQDSLVDESVERCPKKANASLATALMIALDRLIKASKALYLGSHSFVAWKWGIPHFDLRTLIL